MRCTRCDPPRPLDGPFCPSCGALSEEPPPIEDAPHDEPAYRAEPTLPPPRAATQVQPPLPLAPEQPGTTGPRWEAPAAELPRDTARYRELLQERFGYPDFRPGQAEVLEALASQDVLGVMPTGGGKSLCYVLPALEAGRTLVISPLIALMQDQVEALEAVGVPASFINSTLNRAEQNRRYADFEAGRTALLYVAPERLANRRFLDGLARGGVRLLVIDEAHCISEWGHDFRPDYLALGGARERLGRPRTLALTATADPTVRKDILARLGIASEAREVLTSFDRPNLRFQVMPLASAKERLSWLIAYARERRGQSGIVYARTRRSVEETAETLNAAGVPAEGYHAGMGGAVRAAIQRRFTTGRAPLIVATNAFGLGIDKPDVRYVVHLQMPGRLEAYYQEAGRAGRDGEPAECTLLYSRRDHSLQRRFIDQAHPDDATVQRSWQQLVAIQRLDPQRRLSPSEFEDAAGTDGWALTVKALRAAGLLGEGELILRSLDPDAPIDMRVIEERRRYAESRLAQMVEYAETSGCRRELILRYFGEPQAPNGARNGSGCSACDNCSGAVRAEAPEYPHDLFASILELRDGIAWESNRAPYMVFEERTAREVATYRPSGELALLEVWGMGRKRVQWFGERLLDLVRVWEAANPDAAAPPARPAPPSRQRSAPGGPGPEVPFDDPLFQRLREWRRARASRDGIPAYTLFTDRSARELTVHRPADRAALADVWGFGDRRIAEIGDELLELLRDFDPEAPSQSHPEPPLQPALAVLPVSEHA
ncbi:MAG: RecQ family ATP-dependent DNA helicase [Chloroflexi bacterium]|nr:RecQ family ATP-dependent DNA helicase [Chloroflexota bacterium]